MTSTPRPATTTRRRRRLGVVALVALACASVAAPTGPPTTAPAAGAGTAAVRVLGPPRASPPQQVSAGTPWSGRLVLPGGLRVPTLTGPTRSDYAAPVAEPVVRTRFDPPPRPWSAGHRGVDLAAPAGTPVRSPGPGVVVHAGSVVDRGVITVRHPDGLRSSLEPVTAQVAVGDVVVTGSPLGVVQDAPGRTHCEPRCLHWGVRDGQDYLDPLSLLASEPVVLLPLGDGSDR